MHEFSFMVRAGACYCVRASVLRGSTLTERARKKVKEKKKRLSACFIFLLELAFAFIFSA